MSSHHCGRRTARRNTGLTALPDAIAAEKRGALSAKETILRLAGSFESEAVLSPVVSIGQLLINLDQERGRHPEPWADALRQWKRRPQVYHLRMKLAAFIFLVAMIGACEEEANPITPNVTAAPTPDVAAPTPTALP
jgi:hypothetical protein